MMGWLHLQTACLALSSDINHIQTQMIHANAA